MLGNRTIFNTVADLNSKTDIEFEEFLEAIATELGEWDPAIQHGNNRLSELFAADNRQRNLKELSE
jgi:hypothetical protein